MGLGVCVAGFGFDFWVLTLASRRSSYSYFHVIKLVRDLAVEIS